MAFKKKVYKLTWDEGHPYHGLEIRVKGLSFGDLTLMKGLAGKSQFSEEDLEPILELFADKIVSWNYEDDNDVPVPVSLEAVRELDAGAVVAALLQWQEAVAAIGAPLKKDSPSGETSLEASIPMEDL